MKKYILFCIVSILFVAYAATAQDGYNERAKKYVEQFYPLAIAEQRATGIPASVTLGQGILETEAGASELMTIANNHFGIKCNNGWSGPTFTHTDDAPDECFKKYSCAAESYRDHSLHLKRNPRYAPLFKLSETDYASWAVCLKKCGYATNPQYAKQLIKIIEDFKLQEYTYSALDSTNSGNYPVLPVAKKKEDVPLVVKADKEETQNDASDTEDSDANTFDSSNIITVNGMKAFYANKGETLLKYADQYHVKYGRLLEMNDLPDAPIPFSMYVYLEKKLTSGTHPQHKVLYGETLYMISQTEGIQYKKLLALNLLSSKDEPATGAVLELQKTATRKPELKTGQVKAHTGNAIVMSSSDPAPASDYIAIDKSKPSQKQSPVVTADDDYVAAKPATNPPVSGKPIADNSSPVNKPKPAAAKPVAKVDHSGYETNWDDADAAAKPTAKTKPTAKPKQGDGYETNWDDADAPAKPEVAKTKPAKPVQGDGFETNWDDANAPAKPAAAKNKPAAKPAQGDGYVTNWDEHTPAPAKAVAPAAKSMQQPAIVKKDNNDNTENKKSRGANPEGEDDDDLSSLKADMDKVVYADNSKLASEKAKNAQPSKKEPVIEEKEPAKEKAKLVAGSSPKYYTIKRGETAFSIAKRNNISVEDLLKMNDIDASGIKTGYKIKVKE